MRKSLRDISWQVTEPEYRADPALSYSTLSRFEREGFAGLDKLFEKVESPSLQFGSLVDTLMTGTEEEFEEHFMVAQLDNSLSDTLITITKKLFDRWKGDYTSITDIPDDYLIATIADIQWNNHWQAKTRAKKIKEDCAGYYKLLYLSENKTIVSTVTYQDALNCVDRLKAAPSTKFYFEADNIFDNNIERLYQLKFKATLGGVDYRCMADLLVVIHDKKIVVPVDLKTSYKPEYDFPKSFIEWNYHIQARLYWLIIRHNMDQDPYFKDFKLADYRFIVINRKTLNPLVWNWNMTQNTDEIITDNGNVLRHPLVIGAQLRRYLDENPTVPDGIDPVKPNELNGKI
jgi:hypothetical protein